MKCLELNEITKPIIRDYYVNLYKIELNDAGIFSEEAYKEIDKYVDKVINRYIEKGYKTPSFSKYIANYNFLHRKYNIRFISTDKKAKLVKKGHSNYINTIIDYYKMIFEYNIEIANLKEKIDKKDLILREGKVLIEKTVKKYFDIKINLPISKYMSNTMQLFYLNNNIKLCDSNNSIVIDNKKGDSNNRGILYDSYYKLALKRVNNICNLPKEKFELFIKEFVKNNINAYFEGEEKNSTLNNYTDNMLGRINKSQIKMLVEYNLLFSDYYDESIIFLEEKASEVIKEFIKENNVTSISIKYILQKQNLCAAKAYLDRCIQNKKCFNFNMHVKAMLKVFISDYEDNKNQSNFDINLATNGDEEDRKIEFEILLNELSYLKDLYKNKYIYYTDFSEVNKKIEENYYKFVHFFIYEKLSEGYKIDRTPSSYVSNRLSGFLKQFSKTTENRLYKKGLFFEFNECYNEIVSNYLRRNNLSEDEKLIFVDYVDNAFRSYINKGSYDIDIRWYMKNIIDGYDYEVAKYIFEIKKYEQNNLKVLRSSKRK